MEEKNAIIELRVSWIKSSNFSSDMYFYENPSVNNFGEMHSLKTIKRGHPKNFGENIYLLNSHSLMKSSNLILQRIRYF